MKFVVEFYRIRSDDDAHAVIGRETVHAADPGAAIDAARRLAGKLDMPQLPDAMSIRDEDGTQIYLDKFVRAANSG